MSSIMCMYMPSIMYMSYHASNRRARAANTPDHDDLKMTPSTPSPCILLGDFLSMDSTPFEGACPSCPPMMRATLLTVSRRALTATTRG